MGLSNAERQRRFTARLKARATRATALQIENAALRKELSRLKAMPAWRWSMPRSTYAALVKVLHPDQRKHASPKQIDQAFGMLAEWWSNRN